MQVLRTSSPRPPSTTLLVDKLFIEAVKLKWGHCGGGGGVLIQYDRWFYKKGNFWHRPWTREVDVKKQREKTASPSQRERPAVDPPSKPPKDPTLPPPWPQTSSLHEVRHWICAVRTTQFVVLCWGRPGKLKYRAPRNATEGRRWLPPSLQAPPHL